jgi:hypothetical protein
VSWPLAVTVSSSAKAALASIARARAEKWGLPYYERPRNTGLTPHVGVVADAFLVLGGDGWSLTDAAGALQYSPGMAQVRLKRLDAGQATLDVVVRLMELAEGDTVIDATLGLGADALVCARAVGPRGRVIGIERSLPLYALVSEGLARGGLPERCAPVEVRWGDALEVLKSMAAKSADCVLFDPMFDKPKRSSPAFELLRRYASHEPLTEQTLGEARRVARRWVVVKGGRFGAELERLGLVPEPTSRHGAVVWARLRP